MNLNYTTTVRTIQANGNTLEIKRTDTAIFYAIYKNGQKITDFMNASDSDYTAQIKAHLLKKEGIRVDNRFIPY